MLKKLIKRIKSVKAFLAVGAAVTMLLGTSLTALASPSAPVYTDPWQCQTNPRTIQEADETVIATSDATQLYLTGSLTMIYDRYGSPDPQLINNGDGTWTLIMYQYQEVVLGLNNPYTDYVLYKPQVAYANPTYCVDEDGEIDPAWDDLVKSWNEEAAWYPRCNWSDTYNYVYIDANQNTTGSALYNIQLEWDYTIYNADGSAIYREDLGAPETIGNTVTVAVYVLPAQVGYQEQILAAWEQVDNNTLGQVYLKNGVRNSKAIN